MRKHTCHLQQPVSQSAFAMVNMSNDAKVPDSVCRKLGQVNRFLNAKGKKPVNVYVYVSYSSTAELLQ